MDTLRNQHAVVTGASSGIGRAIAVALAAEGASVWLVGRRPERLAAVADELRAAGATAQCLVADLAAAGGPEALADHLRQAAPSIDVLVHAAGVIEPARIEHATAGQLDAQYRTNVLAPFLLTRGLLQSLEASRGQVVFVNSTAGLAARAGVGLYAASKHAFKALADSLREEVNASGVRVLSLYLGRTATSMQQAVHASEGRAWRPEQLLQPEDVARVALLALTLPRTAEVTDVTMRPLVKSS